VEILVAQPSDASEGLASLLRQMHSLDIHCVESIALARVALETRHFAALLLDLELSETGCIELLESIEARPRLPQIVVMGNCGQMDLGFRLAQLGVRAVLRKPIEAHSLALALERAWTEPPNLRRLIRSSVGLVGVRAMEDLVRSEMVAEALARSHGSRRGAASMLRISRQLLQHIMRTDSGTTASR
jgi:two-component system, response regulator RegA